MIGQLRGILAVKKPPYIIIDVNGVGYELQLMAYYLYVACSWYGSVCFHTFCSARRRTIIICFC